MDQATAWRARKGAWERYVDDVLSATSAGGRLPLGPSTDPLIAPSGPPVSAPKVLYCAPHPDDECLSGALALRLRLESGAEVTNVAVTLGSNSSERPRRLRELESACRVLGFKLIVPRHPHGFDRVNLTSRQHEPDLWRANVACLAEIFTRETPSAVFAPHSEDFNSTHIGAHHLVVEALQEYLHQAKPTRGVIPLVETEFWHQHGAPNLMVGVSPEIAALQLMAAAEHGGEMSRNPYHLCHVGRLMDNLRRGSEVVGGQGAAAQKFRLAELYRVSYVGPAGVLPPRKGGEILPPEERADLSTLEKRFVLEN